MRSADPNFFRAWNTLFGLGSHEEDSFQQLLESGCLVRKAG